MPRQEHLLVASDGGNTRLDLFIAGARLGCSRSFAQTLIERGAVLVNGSIRKSSYLIRPGDRIDVTIPDPELLSLDPEVIPLDIVFEDGDLLVINKPAGMIVHPALGARRGTLVNALLAHCDDLSGINGVLRPGIVHRLDKGTSGLLLVAKNDDAHRSLAAQLKSRRIERHYTALVWGGMPANEGTINAPIGRHPVDRKRMAVVREGRPAVTHYRVVEEFDGLTLLSVRLETGRTHQIRVHMAHIGHPIFGDPTYRGREERLRGIDPRIRERMRELLSLLPRQALHAGRIRFVHPRRGEWMELTAEVPEDMGRVLDTLRGNFHLSIKISVDIPEYR